MKNLYRIDILESGLKHLTETIPSIHQTVIVSIDGFVVASHPSINIDEFDSHSNNTQQVAAMAAALIALGDQTLNRLDQGDMSRLMIEGHHGAIIVYPINRSAALSALVSKTAKMGLTLHEIARAAQRLSKILPESRPKRYSHPLPHTLRQLAIML